MKLAFIGAGNVAWHLSAALDNAGHPVVAVYSRHLTRARRVAERLFDATPTDDLDFRDSAADVFLLCVSDDALPEVVGALRLPERGLLVHTSGTRSLIELQDGMGYRTGWEAGVFYPLQTFSEGVPVELERVPICLEASDSLAEEVLIELAQAISTAVYTVNSDERRVIHLAAVLSSNFTNHLWAIAKEMLEEHDLDFELLKPLLHETFQKAMRAAHPAEVQTGPARRGDTQIMQAHLNLLRGQSDLQNLYRQLSQNIQKWYS
jgi:predicted short-subunit dehydrogenase-like oxidoreductase (DUF2520 family)